MALLIGGQPGPAVSLHSFILGFLIGCVVFYTLHCTGSVDVCIGCEAESTPFLSLPPSLSPHLHSHSPHSTPDVRQLSSAKTTAGDRTHDTTATEAVSPAAERGCPESPLRLVILVLSTPGGSLRRNAIRGTWLHDSPRGQIKATVRFLIGAGDLTKEQVGNLTAEEEIFHDILFLSRHKEAYSNLTAKVLLGIVWADQNVEFDYLVKADDDSYIRIKKLELALRAMHCPPRLYWGYFMGHAIPETSGRWRERHWTVCPHYLPYAMGGGYVLSRSLVRLLGRLHHRLKLYSNEDVSLGSWLAPFHITRHHDLRFNTEAQSHGCNNHYIISHKEKVRGMYQKYVLLKRNGTFCSEEKEIRPSYLFNWTASSPMDCCERIKGIPIPDDTQ